MLIHGVHFNIQNEQRGNWISVLSAENCNKLFSSIICYRCIESRRAAKKKSERGSRGARKRERARSEAAAKGDRQLVGRKRIQQTVNILNMNMRFLPIIFFLSRIFVQAHILVYARRTICVCVRLYGAEPVHKHRSLYRFEKSACALSARVFACVVCVCPRALSSSHLTIYLYDIIIMLHNRIVCVHICCSFACFAFD